MDGKHLYIDLGSGDPKDGEFQPEGYILQDIQPLPNVTLVCDIVDLDKHIQPEQCLKIRASHVLEHFPTRKIPELFTMIYRLLEKDGEFEIHVPNFRWHAQLLAEERDDEAVNYCFGGQKDEYDFHKTGFTPKILSRLLTEAGFRIEVLEEEHSLHVSAKK